VLENESVWKEGEENNVIDFLYIYRGDKDEDKKRSKSLLLSSLSNYLKKTTKKNPLILSQFCKRTLFLSISFSYFFFFLDLTSLFRTSNT
jgi:hypothetical protein